MKNYKVTAECVVHIPMNTSAGATLATLYRDATFNADENSDQIKHLLESGMIVELDGKGQPVKTDDESSDDGDETAAETPKRTTSRTTTKAKPDTE